MSEDHVQRAFIVDKNVLTKVGKSRRRRGAAAKSKKPGGGGPRKKRGVSSAIKDCSTCCLCEACESPKMEPRGKGKLRIVVLGEAPSEKDDKRDRPFSGERGDIVRSALEDFGLDLDRDCLYLNAIQCVPKKTKTGKKVTPAKLKNWADCCKKRVSDQLEEFGPDLIIALGLIAARSVLDFPDNGKQKKSVNHIRGTVFPSTKYNCWVAGSWDLDYIIKNNDYGSMFRDHIEEALNLLEKPIPSMLPRNCEILNTVDKVREFFEFTKEFDDPWSYDYETNGLLPYRKDAKIHCASFAVTDDQSFWLPLDYKDYWSDEELVEVMALLAEWVASSVNKKVQNLSMEEKWNMEILSTPSGGFSGDTMVTEHICDPRRGVCGLDWQVFRATGDKYKATVDLTKPDWADHEPEALLQTYSGLDAQYTIHVDKKQQQFLEKHPALKGANEFFMKCLPSLVRMEHRGMGVDRAELDRQTEVATIGKGECEVLFKESDFVEAFKKKTGRNSWGPGSDKDFKDMFYETLDLQPPEHRSATGGLPADKVAVAYIVENATDTGLKEFCNAMTKWRQLDTLISTFLGGFDRQICEDGLIHPGFLLHTVESFRSSSANPNFQNLPKRGTEHKDFRKIVVPHIGDLLGEIDASGAEVGTVAMVSKDPILTKQVQEGFDPHSYWAGKLFDVTPDKVTKMQRFLGKNKLVFPLFYGSYYKTISRDFKEIPLDHIQDVEKEFWRMYKGVKQWQNSTVKFYNRTGYVELVTGFRRYGPLSRNQIFNTPIQGASFHMLLESLFQTDIELMRRGLTSAVVCQVHDSIVPDIVSAELEEVQAIAVEQMTKKIWPWQGDVPRGAEWLHGRNWGEQVEYPIDHLIVR